MQEQNNKTTENSSDTKPSNAETTLEQKENTNVVRYDDWGNEIRD